MKNILWADLQTSLVETNPHYVFRSSRPEVFLRKGVRKYAANVQDNTHAEVRFQLSYCTTSFPVDTGRKLNVLCTSNLRPVSTRLKSHLDMGVICKFAAYFQNT